MKRGPEREYVRDLIDEQEGSLDGTSEQTLEADMLDVDGNAIVLLDEEYGYRHHVWLTGMKPAELEAFWAAIPDVYTYYMNPSGNNASPYENMLGEDRQLPGVCHTAESVEDVEFWEEQKTKGSFYCAHLHSNDDSYLKAPDGRVIYHAGYQEREQDES